MQYRSYMCVCVCDCSVQLVCVREREWERGRESTQTGLRTLPDGCVSAVPIYSCVCVYVCMCVCVCVCVLERGVSRTDGMPGVIILYSFMMRFGKPAHLHLCPSSKARFCRRSWCTVSGLTKTNDRHQDNYIIFSFIFKINLL